MDETILALDLGGSKFLLGIISKQGDILAREKYFWSALTGESVMTDLINAVRQFCSVHTQEYKAIGVTIPGLADAQRGIWLEASFSGIRNLEIAKMLQEEFGCPVYIDNDVNACAIAEKMFGCCKEVSDFAWITVSNGIGGALYLNNDIYYGAFGNAGEIGHLTVEDKGRFCNCGSRGCLEMYAAGPAISRNYMELRKKRELTKTLSMETDIPTAQELARRAKAGEELAIETFHLEGQYLGKAVAAIANLFNPGKVVFGGGVMESFDLIAPSLMESYKKHVYYYANRNLEIVRTKLGYEAALLGAAAVALRRIDN